MISIIIPAYNVEKYLSRCLDSIINQNNFDKYKDNIEIIIINDGSFDDTAIIASEYCNEYSFINMYSQTNGGLSAARNFGLQNSSGKYVWFIDSDDWIAQDSFQVIFDEISKADIDILEFDVMYAIEHDKDFLIKSDHFYSSISTDLISSKYFLEREGYIVSVTSKLIKKSLFDLQAIQFPLKRFSEDNIVALKLMLSAKNYKKIKRNIYFYYQRNGSITNNKNINHIKKYLNDQILNCKDIDRELLNYNFNKSKIREMQAFIVSNILLSLMENQFQIKEVMFFIKKLESIGQYPVKQYKYYNIGIKRELFRRIFNHTICIKIYKFIF
ncbi:glycosyltransferase [Chryseobacterium sp.]|uniref:glycosyltransferase family 2 protein n=1 Tax=Chryseobacterium sp. TaxID=1871047 RepID=UPI0012C4E5BD|nr:glycosyltransferase [Chryseobacterium sp.]MPS65209.1 glycosyltransferase [Chryseobacterium sp.]